MALISYCLLGMPVSISKSLFCHLTTWPIYCSDYNRRTTMVLGVQNVPSIVQGRRTSALRRRGDEAGSTRARRKRSVRRAAFAKISVRQPNEAKMWEVGRLPRDDVIVSCIVVVVPVDISTVV